jgi:hypothetical protein
MTKRIKRPLVEPGKRREWFQLYEEKGQSPVKIAKDNGYDARTVRSQIELERQERAKKEARTMVLRDLLKEHYNDIYDFAHKLDIQLGSERTTRMALREDSKWLALHEHLPRSIIWKNLDKWEKLQNKIIQLNVRVEQLLEAQIASRLKATTYSKAVGLNKRIFNALISHVREAAQGRPEILESFDLEKISESQDSSIKRLIQNILKSVATWEEYNDLIQQSNDLSQVRKILHDELLIIQMRRMVPGKCRYCPF